MCVCEGRQGDGNVLCLARDDAHDWARPWGVLGEGDCAYKSKQSVVDGVAMSCLHVASPVFVD